MSNVRRALKTLTIVWSLTGLAIVIAILALAVGLQDIADLLRGLQP